jgi:hypothetical protein
LKDYINHLVRGPSAVPHKIIKGRWRSRPPDQVPSPKTASVGEWN